jgi:hypothetical protein
MRDDDRKPAGWGERGTPTSEQADRERRLNALRHLAREATAATPAPAATTRTPLRTPRRTRSARGPLLGLLAVVVVAAGAGVYLWRSHQSAKATVTAPIPATLTINLTKSKLYCPQSLTWSPDGLTVAVFADRTSCSNGGGSFPVLALFNARTGALERTYDPYAALIAANVQGAYVQDVVWSPDRKSLIFLVGYNPNLVNAVPGSGLLYYPLSGGTPRYVRGPAVPGGGVIWNVQTGTPVTSFDNPTLPHAPGYSWSSDGHLIGDDVPSAAPGHASIFRAGTLLPIQPVTKASQDGPDSSAPPLSLLYLSWGTLVSPDGTYVAMNARLGGRLPLSSTPLASTLDPQICGFYAFDYVCDYSRYSTPDAGFAAVVAATAAGYNASGDPSSTVTQWDRAELAYRPDSKVAAAILPGSSQGTAQKRITLFDTANGAQIGTVSAPTQANSSIENDGIPVFVWSPTGKQLGYVDFFTSSVTLWGGSSLPA